MDCALVYDDACGWDDCVDPFCAEPTPAIYGEVTESGIDLNLNGIVNIFDV